MDTLMAAMTIQKMNREFGNCASLITAVELAPLMACRHLQYQIDTMTGARESECSERFFHLKHTESDAEGWVCGAKSAQKVE
eukprot:2761969-Rhodomonas_salina.2